MENIAWRISITWKIGDDSLFSGTKLLMRYLPLLISFICLLSCGDKKNSLVSKYLNSDNIPAQKITVDVTRDTVLVLKGGTKLHIPKGTLRTKDGKPAVLQVKEVLTPEQILAAGMFTESDGRPLSSGGMLFIDADSSVDVELAGQIVAEIPTQSTDEKMQLFKGEKSDDGTINWTDPEELSFNKVDSSNIGELLFKQNCASCHHPTKDMTGPAVAGADQRHGMERLVHFIKNPTFLGESLELCISSNMYAGRGIQMPPFPSLSNSDIEAIIDYANTEALKQGIYPSSLSIPAEVDSCMKSIAAFDLLSNARDSLEASRQPFITVTNIPDQPMEVFGSPDTVSIWEPKPDMVNPQHFKADYYRIEIETFGWYNIDHFIEAAQDSELFVKLTGTHSNKNQVFLVIPSIKMMVEGGFLDDSSSYGFYTKDGKMPLVQGLEAFVFAMGESPDNPQLYFGQTKFVTTSSQVVNVRMQPLSQEQLQKNINYFSFADFKAEVKRESTKENIRSLDEKLINLREKLKNCDCRSATDTMRTASIINDWMVPEQDYVIKE